MTFHDFWTNENNPTLPKSEYLYNTRHILVLVGTVLACLILTLIFYKKSEKAKNILLYVLASILLFFEITSRIVNLIITDDYGFENIFKILVPMHICSVMVWVFIIAIFSHSKTLMEYSVIDGIFSYRRIDCNGRILGLPCCRIKQSLYVIHLHLQHILPCNWICYSYTYDDPW